jgi:hypothetical protein
MSFVSHLTFLTSSRIEHTANDKQTLQNWKRFGSNIVDHYAYPDFYKLSRYPRRFLRYSVNQKHDAHFLVQQSLSRNTMMMSKPQSQVSLTCIAIIRQIMTIHRNSIRWYRRYYRTYNFDSCIISLIDDSLFSRKPDVQHLLGPLRTILASSHPNDTISEELAELLGFDDIELITEILNKREEVLHAVSIAVIT